MEEINRQDKASESKVVLIIVGWISAVVSLFVYPFIFGFLGVVMGILATKSGSRAGLSVIVASIILMAIGLIFGVTISNNARQILGI